MEGVMDQELRKVFLEKVSAMVDEGDRLVAVPVDDFFNGNSDEKSIGVNLLEEQHIGLSGFRRVLSEIRDRPDVQDIFIELTEIVDVDDEEDADIWPTGCVAFIITSASLKDVEQWVAPLHPRHISEGWNVRAGIKTPLTDQQLQDRMRPVRVWLL
jgi:hypothetical protein